MPWRPGLEQRMKENAPGLCKPNFSSIFSPSHGLVESKGVLGLYPRDATKIHVEWMESLGVLIAVRRSPRPSDVRSRLIAQRGILIVAAPLPG